MSTRPIWNFRLRRARSWWSVYATIGALLVAGMGIASVAAAYATDLSLANELFKSGVTVAVVTVAGALVTIALKRAEEVRARDAELRGLLHSVVETYNAAKHCRRRVKSLCLPFGTPEATLTDHQAAMLSKVLPEVSRVQLQLEAIKRELPYAGLFDERATIRTRALLHGAEEFMNDYAVTRREEAGSALAGGTARVSQFLNS